MTDWDSIYSYVIAATGWTWEYIDEFLTLPRLWALQAHWAKYPPIHITAAVNFPLKTTGAQSSKPAKRIENVWQGATVINDAEFARMALMHPGIQVQHKRLPR